MATIEETFARQEQTWASCPDIVETMILDKIRSSIRAKMERENTVYQDRRKGFKMTGLL